MLELRPNCECCDKDLPPDSLEAVICTFECTFCQSCASGVLATQWVISQKVLSKFKDSNNAIHATSA